MDELDLAMTGQGVTGTIELVGGAAMALAHYDRVGTTDVDGSCAVTGAAPSTPAMPEDAAERRAPRGAQQERMKTWVTQ